MKNEIEDAIFRREIADILFKTKAITRDEYHERTDKIDAFLWKKYNEWRKNCP